MKFKKTLMALAVASISSSVSAFDLSEMTKIKEGHYASIDKDGRVFEVATSSEVMAEFGNEIDQNYHSDISKHIKIGQNLKQGGVQTSFTGCSVNAIQGVRGGGPTIQNGIITIGGSAQVSEPGPSSPLQPKFAFSRVKAAIKGLSADGTLVERNFDIERDVFFSGDPNYATSYSAVENRSIFTFSQADASIGLAGLDSYSWSIRSEFVIDKPTTDSTTGPERQFDCFEAFSARTFNTVQL